MYEIAKFMVYKFTVYCLVYSTLLLQVTDQSVRYYTFALLTASLFSTNQRAITLLHCCSANQ